METLRDRLVLLFLSMNSSRYFNAESKRDITAAWNWCKKAFNLRVAPLDRDPVDVNSLPKQSHTQAYLEAIQALVRESESLLLELINFPPQLIAQSNQAALQISLEEMYARVVEVGFHVQDLLDEVRGEEETSF